MRKIILLALFTTFLFGCNNSTDSSNNNPVHIYKPIFPQPGYNSRNTSNPFGLTTNMQTVLSGVEDWSYTFPGTYFSDGSEFCVDTKGNVYYISQQYPSGSLYKFNQNGIVQWQIDSVTTSNFSGISLSADEKYIYFNAYRGNAQKLYCVDSSGNDIWSNNIVSLSKPLIGKNGTLYLISTNGLCAINSSGSLIWQNNSIQGYYGKYQMAIDNSDNLFVASGSSFIAKTDNNGSVIWKYYIGFGIYGVVIDGYGNIYFNGSDNRFYCLKSDGSLKWYMPGANQNTYPVITSDNNILIASGSSVVAYDTSGTQIWKSATLSTGSIENLVLDDFNNIYFLASENLVIVAGSVTYKGGARWLYSINMGTTLPAPVLLPSGKFLFAPKRAFKIQCLK